MNTINLKITEVDKHIQPNNNVHRNFTDAQKTKLAKASQDFESLLTGMMLKSMNKTTEGGMFGKDSYGGDVLDTVFESELSSYMTRSQGLGIAKILYKKLTGEELETTKNISKPLIPPIDLKYSRKSKETKSVSPSNSSMNRLNKFLPIIQEAAQQFGVDENLIKSVILTESAANPDAQSKVKAKGLMQLMDSTAAELGVNNVWNPKENIIGGTKYLSKMLQQYEGDVEKSLAAYNAGPSNVEKYDGVPPFKETKNYINRVLGYLNHMEGQDGN